MWCWRDLKALPVSWHDDLADILRQVEEEERWPGEVLDAYIEMIPKVDGDAAPLDSRPLCECLWCTGSWLLFGWVTLRSGFVLVCVTLFTVLGGGGDAARLRLGTSRPFGIEEVLSGVVEGDLSFFVADVVRSFDTVDRGVLDRVLSGKGLPAWLRHVHFELSCWA